MRIQLLSWLLLISLFQNLHFFHVSSQCLDDQRLLLLQLNNSLVYDSEISTKLVKWKTSVDCWNWDGVACDHTGRVISLNLEWESISGGIDDDLSGLFGLRYLERLNLAFNSLNGALIPKGLQNLTNLVYLNLSYAGFGGQVPVEVSTMRSLAILDLSVNRFILLKLENPNLQGLVQNLTGLTELHLDNVDVSAQRNHWCRVLSTSLPNLTALSLCNCGLSGPLDSSLSRLHSLSVARLDGNNLSTTVLDFFANYSNLKTLTLHDCSLQGPFPKIIFQSSTLETLDLSDNELLSGTIQHFPVSSSFKKTIVLRSTNFGGPLPDSISNLRLLSKIDLSSCNFTGIIPATIANLTELVYLDFSYNSFTGSIPFFRMSKKLIIIFLNGNFLTGSLTSLHFEGLSSLVSIDLGDNSLNGSFPASLFGLPSLQVLLLSWNKFSGQISEFSTSNSSRLEKLDLSCNQLEGPIPKSLFGLPSLQTLALFSNKFSGHISEFSTSNSSKLELLNLSDNQLEGPIPESLFKLERLSDLSLESNFFNGSVKLETIQRLSNLKSLYLGHNNLSVYTSNNSSSLPQFPQLNRLSLASWNLHVFPDLRNQLGMEYLDLSSNYITGKFPNWIWKVGNGVLVHLNLSCNHLVGLQMPYKMPPFLGVLDLHSNRLQGQLPMPPKLAWYVDYSSNYFQQPLSLDIGNFTALVFFSLAKNSLTGTIPASLCNLISLQFLDLSSNKLSGSIPPCLVGNTARLEVLNFRGNDISGNIPDTFHFNCTLETLDLSNNNLGGKIPLSLANCKSLRVLNVGNNMINDTFPCMLKNSSSLRVLALRNNKFHGGIRCSRVNGSWPNLQIIDIASNNFSGELYPAYMATWRGMMLDTDTQFGNQLGYEIDVIHYQNTVTLTIKGQERELVKILTIFTTIDFSYNNFTGKIPETVGDLNSLYILNLSHNSFTGVIPSSIGNLKQLGSLDISMNQLTGEIPQELARLTFLSFLNLSCNKLVGLIPTGPQLQTFSEESFAGNPGLCGFNLNLSCNAHADGPGGQSVSILKTVEFDWQLIMFISLGFGFGVALVLYPLAFFEQWREKCNEQFDRFLKMIFHRY